MREYDSGMKFRCASIECPEVFNGPKPECIYQSQFDRCCGKYECSNWIQLWIILRNAEGFSFLDRNRIEELSRTRCYLDNKEYVKGQKMFSDRVGCYACICDESFNNATIANNPNCQKVKCNIEIHYADRFMAGCVPVYYGKFNCCPIDWRCRKWNIGNTYSFIDFITKFNVFLLQPIQKTNLYLAVWRSHLTMINRWCANSELLNWKSVIKWNQRNIALNVLARYLQWCIAYKTVIAENCSSDSNEYELEIVQQNRLQLKIFVGIRYIFHKEYF